MLFDDADVALIAATFAKTTAARGYICHACAIMPDHVHVVVRRHPDRAEGIIRLFQQDSKKALIAAGRRPVNHPVWGGPGWRVFLNMPEQIVARIEYVRRNPLDAMLPEQHWDFVIPYDGWMPSFYDV
jgi:REP element-mobilizing transposase RayT